MATAPTSSAELSPGARQIAESLTPATPATQGYWLNHTMLRISNVGDSLRFYIDFMGMSLIFTLNAGPFVVYYLGYPAPGDKSPADMAQFMSSRSGLLELVNIPIEHRDTHGMDGSPNGQSAYAGFGHLGFYVPNVGEAVNRAVANGYTVVKKLDDLSARVLDLPNVACNTPFHPAFLATFSQVAFIRDPDG